MRSLFIAAILLLPAICRAELIIDVPKIAGRTKEEVAKVIGAPTDVSKVQGGEKLVYRNGDVEIVFVRGKADWITISGMSDVAFNATALTRLGLAPAKPTFQNKNIIRWESVPGYLEIAIFPSQKGCDYAYVQTLSRSG